MVVVVAVEHVVDIGNVTAAHRVNLGFPISQKKIERKLKGERRRKKQSDQEIVNVLNEKETRREKGEDDCLF